MKPLLSTNESCLSESLAQQSFSFSDVFDPSSPSFVQYDPVRASTPVSSDGDVSIIQSNDTLNSILGPQNMSLLTQDLSTSLSFPMVTQSPTKDDSSDIAQQDLDQHCHHRLSSASLHSPYPMCDEYVHGSMCYGFKLVGDNLDKTIKPRDMCVDHLPQSLHYFNVYAVSDRVDFSSLHINNRCG